MKYMKWPKMFMLFLSVLLLNGCIKDGDPGDCPSANNVVLNFNYPDFPLYINRVDMGIFNHSGSLVEIHRIEKDKLNTFQGISLNLEAGNYTAICWANAFENTHIAEFIKGAALSACQIHHPHYNSLTKITTNDSLYYAKQYVDVLPNEETKQTVDFTPAHIKIKLSVKGLSNTHVNTPVSKHPFIRINNLQPYYDFNMISGGSPTAYYPKVTVNTAALLATAVCNVLRFANENSITIDVIENATTNKVLWTVNLKEFLAANNIVIMPGQKLNISVLITFTNDNKVVVTLNNWDDNPIQPDI